MSVYELVTNMTPAERVTDILLSLAACLCNQIEEDGSPTPCFCGVVPGDGASLDYGTDCEGRDGMGWVRLINMYPASSVGSQNTTVGNCDAGIGADIEIGLVRAIQVAEDDGDRVSAEVLEEATRQAVKDALTVQKAVKCCDAISSKDSIVGMWSPLGPLGGIYGGGLQINIAI